jgi:hypothetical protein
MSEQAEKPVEPKPSRDLWSWTYWLGVAAALYVLASGPAVRLYDKLGSNNSLGRAIDFSYVPLGWAYYCTPLHKPLGMYWHFWDPRTFDKAGNVINKQKPPEASPF